MNALGIERNRRFCVRGDKLCWECSQIHASQEFPSAALHGVRYQPSFGVRQGLGENTMEEPKSVFLSAVLRRKVWVPLGLQGLALLCRDIHANFFLLLSWVQGAK